MGRLCTYRVTLLFMAIYLFSNTHCLEESLRDPKLSIFQVVKFQNSPCTGSSRNGTCYTAAECSDLGGSQDQTCADGFGVCCVVIVGSGETASVNNSYIIASSTDLTSGSHEYTICPCSNDICRIRFDFTSFVITGPVTGFGTVGKAGDAAHALIEHSLGDCTQDQFYITGTSGRGTPTICGTNSGDHMIVDTNGSGCTVAHFGISATSLTTRAVEIKVTQYRCGDEMGGPQGCLQWHLESTGRVKNFNFPTQTAGTNVAYSVVHLSQQQYDICIRKAAGMEYICYVPCTDIAGVAAAATAAVAQGSFGLSIGANNAAAQAMINTLCSSDYIIIPQGNTAAIVAITTGDSTDAGLTSRFCGREFGTTQAETFASISICSNVAPFKVGVNFDDDEVCTAVDSAITCESEVAPGGIVGFSLCYVQASSG